MAIAATRKGTQVTTGRVRLSYVHLFEPFSTNPDQEPRYSCVLVIPKSEKSTLRAIREAQKEAAELGKAKFGGKVPKGLKITLHDGDEEGDLERNPEYEDAFYMSVGSKSRPGIVDADVQPILDSTEVYSGIWARVAINAFAYNTNGNRGISFGLNHVQKLEDDDALDGRTKAEDVFSAVDSGTDDEDDDEDLL